MGNCLRLGISRVGLAWSKWRMSAKFKRKNISVIILGMQAVGKTTIALRLYKFKKALPDTKYVQTKGFNTYTIKRRNKTTVNIYDLGGHSSIQELWDHYYADSHGIIFVVDTSKRETVPETGQLLSQVLRDHRIRGKPVLLLANKVDLDGITENELDSMLNLQQLVNSVRCLTRLDVSCATDLKNDKGIFEGFKWLISYIERNYHDLNNRVLSDTMEEKNREKERRAAVLAAREAEQAEEESRLANELSPGSPLATSTPRASLGNEENVEDDEGNVDDTENRPDPKASQRASASSSRSNHVEAEQERGSTPQPRPISVTKLHSEPAKHMKIPGPLLPPIHNVVAPPFVDQPVKLPRLKSPKSRPEVINRLEDTGFSFPLKGNSAFPPPQPKDQYYDENNQKFRKISAARRLSPEGADSDDGIINMAYEPNEDISSDSTPIGVRKHNFSEEPTEGELQNKELFMITTLAEVHKEYFKDRKGSTSTHDSVSMSVASVISDPPDTTGAVDGVASPQPSNRSSLHSEYSAHNGESAPESIPPKKSKSKKRLANLKSRNKTAPLQMDHVGSPLVQSPLARAAIENRKGEVNSQPFSYHDPRANSIPVPTGTSNPTGKMPFTVSTAWGSSEHSDQAEMKPGPEAEPGKF